MSGKPVLNPVLNPYTPGAGTPPPLLAGREGPLARFDIVGQRLVAGLPEQGLALVGLRGVGKTVLLRAGIDVAEHQGVRSLLVEGVEDVDSAVPALARRLRQVLLAFSQTAAVSRALRVLKSFSVTTPLGVSVTVDPLPGRADSGHLSEDLADLLEAAGAAARSAGSGLLLAIDEVQDLPISDLAAVLAALHRCSQMALPVAGAVAGLPSTMGHVSTARSYAERMFVVERVGRLERPAALDALMGPAAALGVSWSAPAADEVVERSDGYPYFLQEYGRHVWNVAAEDPISTRDVERAEPAVRAHLDEGFFRARLGRLPDGERRYVRALASLGPGEQRSGAVAGVLGAHVGQVAAFRERLIRAGVVYSPRYGYVAFTVPRFDDFVRRDG